MFITVEGEMFSLMKIPPQLSQSNVLGHSNQMSLDIICSSKLTVFLELRSRKTVRFSEQIMSADKYPSL